jgi:hypothetical protein
MGFSHSKWPPPPVHIYGSAGFSARTAVGAPRQGEGSAAIRILAARHPVALRSRLIAPALLGFRKYSGRYEPAADAKMRIVEGSVPRLALDPETV